MKTQQTIQNQIQSWMKKMKNAMNEENKTVALGLLTLLVTLWVIMYVIPDIFFSLFHTFLGNFILLIGTLLVASNNPKYGIVMVLCIIILYRFSILAANNKEGFSKNNDKKQKHEWSKKSINDFLDYQKTVHPEMVFDMEQIQKQATQEEVDYYMKNKMWPWSEKVIELYKELSERNPYVREDPDASVKYARRIYNQNAILQILSLQTKEGRFLVNGIAVTTEDNRKAERDGAGTYVYSSGLIQPNNDVNTAIIKCGATATDAHTGLIEERIVEKGGEDINMGTNTNSDFFKQKVKESKPISYMDLEKKIPGFTFIDKPCNPCGALDDPPSYQCKYKIELPQNPYESKGISNVWKYLWNMKT